MKSIPTISLLQPMHLRGLNISTHLRLHPEFVTDPGEFALRNGVALVRNVSPATSFKNDGNTGEKTSTAKANIHLVRSEAIRLFTEHDDSGVWIRGMMLNPSLLLYGVKDYPLVEQDLLASLSMLQNVVAPLLTNPQDACHIVPGLVSRSKHVAHWSAIESEVFLPDVLLPCLHGVRHPNTGRADGATKKRMQLGAKGDDCIIRFKHASWESTIAGATQSVQGIRVKLTLRGHALPTMFGRENTAKLQDTMRLVRFRAPDEARVHQEMMSRLEGTYLPVPPEWADTGKPVTHARTIALLSQLTPIPIEELKTMDNDLRHHSDSTRQRLNNDVAVEAARLKPIPVATLFQPEVYATHQRARMARPDNTVIDPRIAAAYGPSRHSASSG